MAMVAITLSACVSMQTYDALEAKYQQLKQQLTAELAADQVTITKLQGELKVTMKDEILFPEGGYRLNTAAKATLNKIVPALQGLQQTKVVVDGYTDNLPVGPELKAQGIADNLDLSSRRADGVVEYLASQGVNQNLLSAQGFGATNPIASNDTAEGRAKNRRIEVTLVGPGT
ncbi:MAG: OmpA family protein [Alphaproteobacteria bacterium]|nr:OmpA family protein [Alphaproteobacteria bacterium]